MREPSRDPEFVSVADSPLDVGRRPDAGLHLFHATVSRHHATLARTEQGLVVTDHDSRYGTFVNGVGIRTKVVQSGDRIQFGTATVYRVQGDGLKLDTAAQGVRLTAEDLTISKGTKVLVKNASFSIQPDVFVGILGPSGAGKSTVLNCLASYHQAGNGRIVFDEQRDVTAERDAYRAVLGHVPQDDVVYPSLSVRENLWFAAQLRLTPDDGSAGVEEAVDQALERVGLTEHAHKPTAVLSGGQRKRLSVAVELLKRPRILLLDEPTSGLDPASEANLMEQLRHVASRGTTVICTTHLMDNVRLFDAVIVLCVADGVGQVAYVGPPAELLSQFQCRNFADLYDALAAGRFARDSSAANAGASASQARQPIPTSPDSSPGKSNSATSRIAWDLSLSELTSWDIDGNTRRQCQIVARRGLLNIVRDRGLWLMMLAQPLVLGLLVAMTQYGVGKLVPVYFFCVLIAIWLGLNNSARDIVRERRHYVRERLAGLHPGAYLGAKLGVYTFVGIIQIVLLILVVRWGCGRTMPEDRAAALGQMSWFWFVGTLLGCYTCGVGLGLLTSTLARTEEAAIAALPLLIMPQLLLSVVAVAGQVEKHHLSDRGFRPLAVTLRHPFTDAGTGKKPLATSAVVVDLVSLMCYSRPGTLLLECRPELDGYSSWIWLVDLCHLAILLLTTWLLAYLVFVRAEGNWPRLVGLG